MSAWAIYTTAVLADMVVFHTADKFMLFVIFTGNSKFKISIIKTDNRTNRSISKEIYISNTKSFVIADLFCTHINTDFITFFERGTATFKTRSTNFRSFSIKTNRNNNIFLLLDFP